VISLILALRFITARDPRSPKSPSIDLKDVSYSREATITAFTDYYTFLTRIYLKESYIVYPLAGG
jgi:hypothetical protein